jgi:hypothetical protein
VTASRQSKYITQYWANISDLVGRVQIPVEELIKNPNQVVRREDGLKGFEDDNDMPGERCIPE